MHLVGVPVPSIKFLSLIKKKRLTLIVTDGLSAKQLFHPPREWGGGGDLNPHGCMSIYLAEKRLAMIFLNLNVFYACFCDMLPLSFF
jgi:hypothetical protein